MIGESLWMLIRSHLDDYYLIAARRVGGIHMFNADENLKTSLDFDLDDRLTYDVHEQIAEALLSGLDSELANTPIFPLAE